MLNPFVRLTTLLLFAEPLAGARPWQSPHQFFAGTTAIYHSGLM